METFDVVIIGSGPGGYVAAIRSAQLGLRTAIIEKEPELGGTCLRIGCIPSKALLSSSHHFAFVKHEAAKHGIVFDNVSLDLQTMLKRKDKVVKSLTGGVRGLMKLNKVSTFQGFGTVTAPGKVSTKPAEGEAQEIGAKHIIIATGSVPVELPSMKFDGTVIVSSTEALSFPEVPKKLLVIGGGAIGLEMGSVWSRLGSEVTVLEFLPRIAVGFDLELANALQKVLTAQGMKFHLGTKVGEVKVENGRATATATKGEEQLTFDADRVLVSVGRRAFPEGVGAGQSRRRARRAEAHQSRRAFPHERRRHLRNRRRHRRPDARAQSRGRRRRMRRDDRGQSRSRELRRHPRRHLHHPEAAGVGSPEDAAKEKGMNVRIGKFPFAANGRALAAEESAGFVKFCRRCRNDRILGAHILSPAASDLMAECVAVMEFGGSSEDLGRTVHAHPTLSEAVKEAALNVNKGAIHIGNR
jgi:dihydrolipoamide dehydrogenase